MTGLRRRSPGRLESEVHAAVAEAGAGGTTVADVIARVDPALAYTTVATTLTRLVDRGVVRRTRTGRSTSWVAVADPGAVPASATARRMHNLLAAAPDRSGALAQFVAGLDPTDEARLLDLLAAAEPDPGVAVSDDSGTILD